MVAQGIRAGNAFVTLSLDDRQFSRSLRRVERRLLAFGAVANRIAQGTAQAFTSIGRTAQAAGQQISRFGRTLGAIGLGAGAGLLATSQIFADFDDELRKLRAITQQAGGDFEGLEDDVRRLGRETAFTARQVAGAAVELGRAGFGRDEIRAALGDVLALSRAVDADLTDATRVAAQVLRAFKLEATTTADVTDVLTATVNGSAQTLADLEEALSKAAPVAVGFGADLRDVSAQIAALANVGIRGSEAGTALARAFTQLGKTDIQERLREIGVEVKDLETGRLRNVVEILGDIGQAVRELDDVDTIAFLNEIFGERAIRAAINLQDVEGVDELRARLDGIEGTAQRTAAAIEDGLGGSFRRVISAAEGLAIAIGEALSTSLGNLLDQLAVGLNRVTEFIEENQSLVVTIGKGVAALVALGGALATVGTLLSGAGVTLGVVGGAFAAAGTAVAGFVSVLVSVPGLIAAAAVSVVAFFGDFTSLARGAAQVWESFTSRLAVQASAAFAEIRQAYQGVVDAIRANDLGTAFQIAVVALRLVWERFVAFVQLTWLDIKEAGIRSLADVATSIPASLNRALLEGFRLFSDFFADVAIGFIRLFARVRNIIINSFQDIISAIGIGLDKLPGGKALGDQLRSVNDIIEGAQGLGDEGARIAIEFYETGQRESRSIIDEAKEISDGFYQDIADRLTGALTAGTDEERQRIQRESGARIEGLQAILGGLRGAAGARAAVTVDLPAQGRELAGSAIDALRGVVGNLTGFAQAVFAGEGPQGPPAAVGAAVAEALSGLETFQTFDAAAIALQQFGRSARDQDESVDLLTQIQRTNKQIADNTKRQPVFG